VEYFFEHEICFKNFKQFLNKTFQHFLNTGFFNTIFGAFFTTIFINTNFLHFLTHFVSIF